MHYLIYKTTNTLNNKIYIGKHKTANKDDDYLGSGFLLKRAITKYGRHQFKKEIILECSNEDELNNAEADIVDDEFVARLDTYNIMKGGYGGFSYVNDNGLNIYDNHSEISSTNMKNACQVAGNKRLEEIRKDKELFEAYKHKMSNALKLHYLYNEGAFTGQKHTDASKAKIGKANSQHQSGKGNSQYGKLWIHNLELKESKRISKDEPMPEGWLKGRKIKF